MSRTAFRPAPAQRTASPAGPRAPWTRSRASSWSLALLGLLVSGTIVYLATSMAAGPRPATPPPGRRIAVPHDNRAPLWEPFRRWVVQEDGRNKPFDTFCREAVRTITGRERFE